MTSTGQCTHPRRFAVCDCKFGRMWIGAERRPLLEEIGSGQHDPWKQLCPLVLRAAPKYAIYGVQQLPRNSNERLWTGFISSRQALEKRLLREDRNGIRPAPACKAIFSGDDFQHDSCETPSSLSCLRFHAQDRGRYARPILAP